MPQRTGLSRSTWLLLLVALGFSAAVLLRGACSERPAQRKAAAPQPGAPRAAQPPLPMRRRTAPAALDAAVPQAAPAPKPSALACGARARKACHQGDVWWFDGCDRPEDVAEACAGRGCAGISCALARRVEGSCGAVTAYGTCERDIARVCISGRIEHYDCGERGERCVMTSEGARCLPRGPEECSAGEAARCNGDRLYHCIDGSWRELDCQLRRARCEVANGTARCSASDLGGASLAAARDARDRTERCDQQDNDGDERIDEGGACDPVELVPFVIKGSSPPLADPARLERELAIVNRLFDPLVFTWADRIEVRKGRLSIAPLSVGLIAHQLGQLDENPPAEPESGKAQPTLPASTGPALRIPVLYLDELGQRPPKAGLTLLPNNSCGGVRVSDGTAQTRGVIVLGEGRQPETLAHELGHYFGLCHTHDDVGGYAQAAAPDLACESTGDGICDTPFDPGAPPCASSEWCDVRCPGGAAPDSANVMSYYFGCRRALSAEQMAEVEHGLGLRRGWALCLDLPDCPCDPAAANTCPADMSCQPGAAGEGWFCALDGAALPGAVCHDATQCSLGSFCLADAGARPVEGRCVRPCRPDLACACIDLGLPFRLCSEDLAR